MEPWLGALSHIRVLDLSRVLAGPWAGQLLGDLGADVIKIERPVMAGDDTRGWGPPFLKDAAGQETRDAAYFLCANRNKQSVTIDFTQAGGSGADHGAGAGFSDILIENFKRGGLAAYGLDYAALSCHQSAADLLLHHRLRADRPLCRPRRLRTSSSRGWAG